MNLAEYAEVFPSITEALRYAVNHGWTLSTHDNIETNVGGCDNVSIEYALEIAAADPSFVYLSRD